MKAWIDGELVPAEEATIPILSHGFSRGSSIFEVLDIAETASGPICFRLDAHVDRFFNSAWLLHMAIPFGKDELIAAVLDTVRANGATDGSVKFFGYYSGVEYGLVPETSAVSVAIFTYDPFGGGRRTDLSNPVAAGISAVQKISPNSGSVHAKACGNYVNSFLAKHEVMQRGYGECIMLDDSGCVAEGSLANIFFVKGDAIFTPELRNALPGITRDSCIEIIRGLNIDITERDITPEEAIASDEAFFTGSVIRIKPIASIDGNALGGSCPGPVTERIRAGLDDAYEGRDPQYESWLTAIT